MYARRISIYTMRISNPTDLHRSKNNARGGAPLYNLNIYPLSLSGFYAVRGLQTIFFSCFQDDRFNHDIDALTGYRTKTLLCMPIKDTNGDVIGVAQVSTYNKKLKRTFQLSCCNRDKRTIYQNADCTVCHFPFDRKM